jgi:hypothetical protein
MLNAPSSRCADKYVVVVAANNEVVATLSSGFHMLSMQLTTMCGRIARDIHLVVTNKMLSEIKS